MKPSSICWMVVACAVSCAAAAEKSSAPEKPAAAAAAPKFPRPTTAEIRRAVDKSLAYVERDGVEWMRDKACITCHQIPAMVWSLNAARAHGHKVDDSKLALWSNWALDNGLKRAVYYKVTEEALSQLNAAGLNDDATAKLKPLQGANYVFVDEFLAAAQKALGSTFDKHKAALLASCAKKGQGGGGAPAANQYMALLLSGAADRASDPRAARRELAEGIVKAQKKDGSWEPAGQFLAQQRPKPETAEVIALWTLLALDKSQAASKDVTAAVEQARKFVKDAPESNNTETIVLRAVFADRDGDDARQAALLKRLMSAQHADGGWGWLLDRPTSDPFTTGVVLWALGYMGRDATDAAVGRAQRYLIDRQGNDGDWKLVGKTISGNTRKETENGDYIYSYWTTGWAIVGLLETVGD